MISEERDGFGNTRRIGKDPAKLKAIPPLYLNVDITWRCNYDCIGCIDGGVVGRNGLLRSTCRDMDWALCQDLLAYATRCSLLGFIVQGGEPLLYPRIDEERASRSS